MERATRSGTKAIRGLHVCPACSSSLVQPTCWEQTDERGRWRLWRRCPECEWSCNAIHSEREIDAYDEELDNGTAALTRVLHELEHENMRHIVEAFAAALEADLISAEDFR
jgi:hypothetical protein